MDNLEMYGNSIFDKLKADNYYAYIIRKEDNTPIGEVDIHWSGYCKKHIIGIVIEEKHRGKGYTEEALSLLCDAAFNKLNLDKIYDDFPATRTAAEKVFSKAGFIREDKEFVALTKERYTQIHKRNPVKSVILQG